MGINEKDLKGYDVKGLPEKKLPEKRFDIDIIEKGTGKLVSHYQRDMPESRALNYQKKAYDGLGEQDAYEVILIEKINI